MAKSLGKLGLAGDVKVVEAKYFSLGFNTAINLCHSPKPVKAILAYWTDVST